MVDVQSLWLVCGFIHVYPKIFWILVDFFEGESVAVADPDIKLEKVRVLPG